MNNNKYIDILHQYWGYDSFRGIQEKIITSIGEGRDTLGLMPTGGGKSICFQVPALAIDGLCIVVTPLIALMKDQVQQLKKRGIRAEAVYSGMSHDDIIRIYDNCVLEGVKILYISPERLSSDMFIAKLKRMRKVGMLVVDEAHCISQWGYDFRPSYLKVAQVKQYIPYDVPILALTATATPQVVDDIQERLGFREKCVFKMSFERKNLIYVVRKTVNKEEDLLHIIRSIPQGSVIVYVRSRRLTSELSKLLNAEGVKAISYHAGLTNAEKDFRQSCWTNNSVRVMVATNAFGMGIDKPDVRLVIHYSTPDSLEAYFQEAGRAGRDGKTSYAVLLNEGSEIRILHQRIPQTYPDPEYVQRVYDDVCCFLQVGIGEAEGRTFDFAREKFCRYFKHYELTVDSALKLLTNAGYITYCEEHDFKSAIHVLLRKEELYQLWNQDKDANNLMQSLLRTYSGVFAEFVYIEETMLSHVSGLPVERIYDILKEWNHNRIIDYVPHRNTPTITFELPRQETERVVLGVSVYDERKENYVKRIEYMTNYISSNDICRSRLLLEYFGEEEVKDCGNCDVCLQRKREQKETLREQEKTIERQILELLGDGQKHSISELKQIVQSGISAEESIRSLLDSEQLFTDGIYVWKR